MKDVYHISNDITLVRLGYFQTLPRMEFYRPKWDIDFDNHFILFADKANSYLKKLLNSVTLLAKKDLSAVLFYSRMEPREIDWITNRIKTMYGVTQTESGTERGFTVHVDMMDIRVFAAVSGVNIITEDKVCVSAGAHYPAISTFYFGQFSSKEHRNENGQRHDPAPNIPAYTKYYVRAFNKNFKSKNIAVAHRIDHCAFTINGERHRRTGPAFIQYVTTGMSIGSISSVKYYKNGTDITDAVKQFDDINDMDEFTWEML